MVEVESACFLQHLPDGEHLTGYSRLYFGAEFCYWRLPPAEEILAARAWAHQAACQFTLATPVLGEDERLRLEQLLQRVLPEFDAGDEILISDWGTLELVRALRGDLTVIAGRALSGQKRGPRILDIPQTPEQEDYFRRGSWHNHEAIELLVEHGIDRLEQDNLLQGLAPLSAPLKGSLHLPYAMVTSSRICPFRRTWGKGPCPVHCGQAFTLQSAETRILLYQDGNTQFLCNDTLPHNLAELGIDRVVRHPQLS